MSMLSPNPQIIRRFSLLFCLLLSLIQLQAQCDPPAELPTVDCINAPVTCLQDACYSTLNEPAQCCAGFCGPNTVIHNPQYFEVIPIADCIEINIHVDGCTMGAGLQSALVTTCNWEPCPGQSVPCDDILDCDPNAFVGQTMFLSACGLTPGVSLWILIDGSNSATCQYTIEYAAGIYEPQIEEELSEGEAIPSSVCQGFDDLLLTVGPPIPNSHGYIWNLEWLGQSMTSTLPELELDIDNNAPPGTWEVCVQAFSGCDTSLIPFCFEVEIYEIDDEEKTPETFCPEEFPFSWHTVTISGPGDYFESFEDADGCRYDSTWTVEEYPEVPVGELEVLFCMNENLDPFIYEGEPYDNSGTYDLSYPGMGLNGCDSTAELILTLVGIDAFIEHECENGEFVLTVLIQELIPANADVSFEWYVDGVLTFDSNPMAILCEGTSVIECFVTVETPAGSCEFALDPYTLNCDAEKPLPPELAHGDTLICAQEGIFFYVIEDPFGEQLFYTWSAPPDVEVYDDGSGEVEMDFSFTLGGQVCVYAENECGIGPTTCFNVEIIPSPVADFNYDLDVCSGETTTITFTGSAGPNAQFIWDFDSPASVTGSGIGPYMVTWNITGDKVVNLTVIEPGCDTAYTSGIISVSNLLTPNVNCSSTINSVTFDWDDVAGASGYLVSIDGMAPVSVPIGTSQYTVGSLTPGTVVTMTLTVTSNGPCPDIVVMHPCTAQDCPAPTIELSGPDSLCLNAPAIVDYDAQVNGSSGTGIWTGPGIVDGNTGAFDPTVSGTGQHLLTYTVTFNGCPFTDSYLVTVFDSITADFVVDPVICISDVANVTYMGNASGGANFDFDIGAATVVSGSGDGPYQLRSNTPGAKTVSLQINENGCTSDLITKSLQVEPTLMAPVVACQSSTSGVTFSWADTPAGFNVNVLSGETGNPITPTQIEFTGLNPGTIVELEIISLTNGPCPIRRDTFYCEAKACPPVLITLTSVEDICLYANAAAIDLEAEVTGNIAGAGDWSGPGIIDPVNGTFDPKVAGPGSHMITFHYLDDGCDFSEPLTINVYDPPIAFIDNSNLILTCTSGDLDLDGSGSTGVNLAYSWSTSNGVIIIGEFQAIATVGAPGNYQLLVKDTVSGCVDSTSVTVSQDANAPIAAAGPDKQITCDSISFVLGGASSASPTITYSWSTSNGNIVGPTDGMTITVDEPGNYIIAVLDASNGCQTSDEAIVTIDTSLASITLTPGDTIDCNTTQSGVSALLSAPVNGYNLQWTTLDGTISGDTTSPDITVTQGGTYTLMITNKNNGCTRSASAFVAESDEIIDDIDASQSNVICFGDQNGTIDINNVIGGNPPYTYQWSPSTGGTTSLSSLGPGQYTLTVSDQNGCTFVQAFTIIEPPKVTADIGPNFTVNEGDSVTINLITNLNAAGISTIDWIDIGGQNCPGCPRLQFEATQSGTIIATVIDTSDCSATDSMRLTVLVPRFIFIPTVFSPNGDDNNDYFFISGRHNLLKVGYMRIFDRWGNQLFEKTDLTPGSEADGWDGKFNDEYVLPGVYVYSAKLVYEDGFEEEIRGDITVLK